MAVKLTHEQSDRIHEWVRSFALLGDVADYISDDQRYWVVPAAGPIPELHPHEGAVAVLEFNPANGHYTWLYRHDDLIAAMADVNACLAYNQSGIAEMHAHEVHLRFIEFCNEHGIAVPVLDELGPFEEDAE